MAVRRSLGRQHHGVPRLAAAAQPWSAMVGHSSYKVRVVPNGQSPDTTGGAHVNNDDLDTDSTDQGNMFKYASKETSHTLDDKDGAGDSGS